MRRSPALKGLVPILLILLLIPSQARATPTTPSWMARSTTAVYAVNIRNTPNTPQLATANWTVLNVTAVNATVREDGLLGIIGSLGVSLISGGSIQLLGLHVVLSSVYNLTDRHCLKPCQALNAQNEHAWEWIPSTSNSSLLGHPFAIMQTVFMVIGNETLTNYGRSAWILAPLIQVYTPSLILYRFWYDQNTGILLQADLFSAGDGNLTITLLNTSPNLAIHGASVPITPIQISIILSTILASTMIIASKMRPRTRNPPGS